MSLFSFTFIFILLLSLHACNARNFKAIDEASGGYLHSSSKLAAEKVMKLKIDRIPIEAREGIADKSHGGAIIPQKPQLMKSKALPQDMKNKKGNEVVEYSSYLNLLNGANIKEPRRGARAALEIGSHHVKEAAKHSNKKGAHEEVVLPDYEPPRRNPPSHNKAN